MTVKITFNGQEYDSPQSMPPDVRAAYQKAMAMLQKGNAGGVLPPRVNVKVSTTMRFVHEGKTYDSLEDLPPEARQKYADALQKIDKDHNGIPDFLEGDSSSAGSPPTNDYPAASLPALAPNAPQPPVIAPENSSKPLVLAALVIILVLILVIAGLVLYISYR